MYYSQQQVSMEKLKTDITSSYPPQSTGLDENDASSLATDKERLSFPQVNNRPPTLPKAESHLYSRHRLDKNKSTDVIKDRSAQGDANLKQIFEIYGERQYGQNLRRSPNSMSVQNLMEDNWSHLPESEHHQRSVNQPTSDHQPYDNPGQELPELHLPNFGVKAESDNGIKKRGLAQP